jgi:C4-dicarboxylate transporter
MHSANLTACVAVPLLLLLAVLVPVLVSAGVCEQPAVITATMAIMARAASGRSFLLMFSPRVW